MENEKYFIKKLSRLKDDYPEKIVDIRGKGLIIAMELTIDGTPAVKACAEKGVLINCTAGNVLRFTPSLLVEEKDIDHLVDVMEEVLGK